MTDPAPEAIAAVIDALDLSPLLDDIDLGGWERTIATVALRAATPHLAAAAAAAERERLAVEGKHLRGKIAILTAERDIAWERLDALGKRIPETVLVCSACLTRACADGVLTCEEATTASFVYRKEPAP